MYLKRLYCFPIGLKNYRVFVIMYPKLRDLVIIRFVDRILVCCKIQKRIMIGGEMPIDLRNSWFFTKPMLVGFMK